MRVKTINLRRKKSVFVVRCGTQARKSIGEGVRDLLKATDVFFGFVPRQCRVI
jgi:hypothetical protein